MPRDTSNGRARRWRMKRRHGLSESSDTVLSLYATQLFRLACIASAPSRMPLAPLGCVIVIWLAIAFLFQLLPPRPPMDGSP